MMRSAIYWAAWNVAAYLGLWLGHVACSWTPQHRYVAAARDIVDVSERLPAWPIGLLPWIVLVIVAVNLAIFAGLRPLGEDCEGRK